MHDVRCDGPARYEAMAEGKDCSIDHVPAAWYALGEFIMLPSNAPVMVGAALLLAVFTLASVHYIVTKRRK